MLLVSIGAAGFCVPVSGGSGCFTGTQTDGQTSLTAVIVCLFVIRGKKEECVYVSRCSPLFTEGAKTTWYGTSDQD